MFRDFVIYGEFPGINAWIGTCMSALVALVLGLALFKKSQDRFVLYI